MSFSFLFATREKHPTFRVDLTELFSKGIAGQGHRIDWVMQAMYPGPLRTEQLNDKERVFVGAAGSGNGMLKMATNHIHAILHDLRLASRISMENYDFIQVRDKPFAAFVALHAARRVGIPFFYWMSFPYPEADQNRIAEIGDKLSLTQRLFYRTRAHITDWLLYRMVLPHADHVFVQSDRMKDDVASRGIAPARMTVVPMGISMEKVQANQVDPACDHRLAGKLPVVYVGTLVRFRGMDFLLHVLVALRQKTPNAVLVFVGDAPEPDMLFLREEAERLGLKDHVIFTGFVPMEEAWGYIRIAAACVSPFRPNPVLDSTSPTKVVEYLAWGRPVVANEHPDQSKVLRESGGGLAVPYTVEAFADALAWILANPEIAQEMGRTGHDYVARHRAYEAISTRLLQTYQALLANNSKVQKEQVAT